MKEYITKGSKLSVVAAHFTLYAFVELKKELFQLKEFRFIFTEPDRNGKEICARANRQKSTSPANTSKPSSPTSNSSDRRKM
ncbi:hypothetical protein P4U24_01200 [Aeribacillus composti]|uniref:hypothetical protein n=1 Tax=Aeribacillus composti TaxID=1868734 RepID=UPI002E22F2C7|nr:hypothetical protein [Aeribacillus composti]